MPPGNLLPPLSLGVPPGYFLLPFHISPGNCLLPLLGFHISPGNFLGLPFGAAAFGAELGLAADADFAAAK